MKKNQLATATVTEPAFEGARLSRRVSRNKVAARWPHRRRAMAVSLIEEVVESRESVLERFWNEHAVKTGIVLFWAWYAVANWHVIGQLLHKV